MTVSHARGLALATIRMDGCWSGENRGKIGSREGSHE